MSAEIATDHLREDAKAVLLLSDTDRIQWIRTPRWIGYTRATQVLGKLRDLLSHPRTHRMPGLLLVAETNNGKSFILQRFRDLNPADENPAGDSYRIPFLLVESPPTPDEGRLYSEILNQLNAPFRLTDSVEKKQEMALKIMRNIKLGMLGIDEIQTALAGSETRRSVLFNVIRFLSNKLQIPIVLAGTKDAFRAIGTDRSISNRFEPVVLPAWEYDDEFLRLLATIELRLPLHHPSFLTSEALSQELHRLSEGNIGELDRLIRRSAEYAINTSKECISIKTLGSIGWVAPSKRKDAANAVR